jgi:transposase
MNKRYEPYPKVTVGMDLGDRLSDLCVLDEAAEVVERAQIRTSMPDLQRRFGGVARMRIVLEVGKQSAWIARALATWGHEVIVANPRRTQLIACDHNKTNTADAESLARLGRADPELLRPIQHRGEEAQADLAVLRARHAVTRSRTILVNHVRGVSKSAGGKLPKCSTHCFVRKVREHIPAAVKPALEPILETIAELTRRIDGFDTQIEQMLERYPEAQPLVRVRGVGALTAMAYVLTLEQSTRFTNPRAAGAYVGLVPRRKGTGDSDPQLHITKRGDKMLRWLLVQCGNYILGPFGEECDLRAYGMRICQRGGRNAKKRAAVAVARKLSVLLFVLWRDGDVYEPVRGVRQLAAA